MALTETIGIGKGSVHITDFVAADLIVVIGQNPGTNHPRMLTTLEAAKRAGATIVADQPAARSRADPVQEPATAERAARLGHATRRRPPPDPDQRRPRVLQGRQPPARSPTGDGTPSTPTFIDAAHERLRPLRRRRPPTFDWERLHTRHRIRPRRRRAVHRARPSLRTHHRLLGDGPHAARQLGGDDPRGGQLPAAARQHRPPGCRRVPRARPLERPGRPHDGDLSSSRAPAFLDALAAEFGFEPPRAHGLDTVDTIRRDARRRRQVFVGHGRQLRVGDARHGGDPRRARTLPAHRAGVDQAQRVAPRRRRPGADPADDGPHRAPRGRRPSSRSSPSRTRWAWSTPPAARCRRLRRSC